MGIIANAFTWWNGASWGTSITSRLNGEEAGRDDAGNIYFKHRKDPARRWVIYAGNNDSSQVPPGWNAWLRGTIDGLPEEGLPARRRFETKSEPNLTGTMAAFRPGGALGAKGTRPAATGDYQPWTPD
ncbi:NADH:ubiquinone oxidoreductase subunit NDUFA12 [Sphingomonas sp.]|uniref:NADH:ubiquinone oxidoreductase subunit NDUFA12 n=1 Tax=Sphingomonas sp. TaxID=28214 RepID=UPI00286D72D4|nr:NADH:ubiquinone oxidoreductase subunit NDUFA12 [Sphingomonas sp.]